MKRIIISLVVLTLFVTCLGCSMPKKESDRGNSGAQSTQTFTDALNRTVTVNQPQRVGAVMGSFAEVWQLAGGKLMAVTQDAVTERGLDLEDGTIDLGSMKTPSTEVILSADLDFLLLSADVSGHVQLRSVLEQAGIHCAYFSVESFEDYLSMLDVCTKITGKRDLYEQNGTKIAAQIDQAVAKSKGEEKPTVLLLRAFSTGVKARGSDNMTGSMLKDLGCINIVDTNQSLLEELSMEQIILEDPDFIFVTTMGASTKKALQTLEKRLLSHPAWKELKAVKQNRYHILPKELFHYKPNKRWGESYEMLAELLYQTA